MTQVSSAVLRTFLCPRVVICQINVSPFLLTSLYFHSYWHCIFPLIDITISPFFTEITASPFKIKNYLIISSDKLNDKVILNLEGRFSLIPLYFLFIDTTVSSVLLTSPYLSSYWHHWHYRIPTLIAFLIPADDVTVFFFLLTSRYIHSDL